MKTLDIFLKLVVLLLSFSVASGQVQKRSGNNYSSLSLGSQDYEPDKLLVKVKKQYLSRFTDKEHARVNGISFSEAIPLLSDNISNARRKPFQSGIEYLFELKLPKGSNIKEAINQAYASGYFEIVEPAFIYKSTFTPDDARFAEQYYLQKINAPAAWDITQGNSSILIAIVDSGVDLDHPDLSDRIYTNEADPIDNQDNDNDGFVDNYFGWDYVGADHGDPQPDNDPDVNSTNNNHGTNVAGCAVASADNQEGIAGVAFNSKILVTKHSGDNREADDPTIIGGYAGIIYAANKGADIINCSWGGEFRSEILQEIINFATLDQGALVVAAAGNEGIDRPEYPAAYDNVISVAALNQDDVRASFSNFGSTVDISAPGVNILTTRFDDEYQAVSGTSFSAPITSGAAALVKAQYPDFNGLQIGEILRVSADPGIYQLAGNNINQLGIGLLDVENALQLQSPSIRLISAELLNEQGNVAQAGETGFLIGEFTNFLWNSSGALTAQLSENSPYVQVNQPIVALGRIETNGTVSNQLQPFEVLLEENVPDNTEISFLIEFSDGTYADYQYFSIVVNPTYLNVDDNLVATTIAGNGRIGYRDNDQQEGIGFGVEEQNILFEMGLILGTSSTQISNAVRTQNFEADQDFVSTQRIQEISPGKFSFSEMIGQFNDDSAQISKSNVLVDYRSMVWQEFPRDKFIIIEYTIKNNGENDLDNFFAGLFADWDISEDGQMDKADWNDSLRLGYVFSSDQQDRIYGGIQVLNGTANYYAIDNDQTIPGNPWGIYDNFSDQEKFQSISSGVARKKAGQAIQMGNDVSHSVAAGPFNVAVEDSVTVAFALHGTTSLLDLISSAVAADSAYNYSIVTPKPVVASDSVCYGSSAILTASGGSNYKWYDSFTGGDPIFTGAQFTTDPLFGDTTFYVSNISGSQESVRSEADVLVKANPNIQLIGTDEFCEGDSVVLSVVEADEYQWNSGQTTQSITVKQAGTFSVNVTDNSLNCMSQSQPLTVSTLDAPVANFSVASSPLEVGVELTFEDLSSDATEYYWQFDDGNVSYLREPLHTYQEEAEYNVTLTVTADNGCSDSQTQVVSIVTDLEDRLSEQLILYPNPVINQIIHFEIPASMGKKVSISLFNASGSILFNKDYLLQNNNVKSEINLHDFHSTIYYLKMWSEKETKTYKIVNLSQ